MKNKTILWFRRDLRAHDTRILSIKASEVLPIFIFDKTILKSLPKDDKRVDFIFKMVNKLKKSLQKKGLDLLVFYSEVKEVFSYLKSLGFNEVYASIDYDNYSISRDKEVEKIIKFIRLNDSYIYDVDEVLKANNTPYVVFKGYFEKAKLLYTKFHALEYEISKFKLCNDIKDNNYIFEFKNSTIIKLNFHITSLGFTKYETKYEEPKNKLKMLEQKILNYEQKRDFLSEDVTSSLSLDIRFGTISIRAILRKLIELKKIGYDTKAFFRQLIFRDFYAYLLYHFPHLHTKDFKPYIPYCYNKEYYERFINAKIGIPIIDASITQLITTGFMHNRSRMIVASFFCKHLMLPWKKGEIFFAKYLMDYDAASNILSWQWSSSTGIDAQPYFRIFNPYTQSKKFDKDGLYIKTYLPFLKNIEAKYLHKEEFLYNFHIKNYIKPIIKHKVARQKFLHSVKRISF